MPTYTREKQEYFKSLGYTDAQSYALAYMSFNGDMEYNDILWAWEHRKESETRPFSEFFKHYMDDRSLLKKDGYEVPEPEPEDMSAPLGGRRLLSKLRLSVFSSEPPLEASGMNIGVKPLVNACKAERVPSPSEMAVCDGFEPPEVYTEPIMENIRTDSYEDIEEKGMRETLASPTSTFRPTYSTAAATVLLSNIRADSQTRHSMVRTEELLNYVNYELTQPREKMFFITKELKSVKDKTYLFLGIQGKRALPARQNICFLLDVSGSMSGRSDTMVQAIFSVISKMNDGDIFSLVTYSSSDAVVVNGMELHKDSSIDELIYIMMKEVSIYGCTNGSAGINKAYDIIQKNQISDGVNRVIILTDGDLNFGIHDKDGLKGLIEKKKESGAYFSAIGTGIFNLQDDKLEILAKNGNGNYFVVNSVEDVKRNIVDRYESLVFPIAKNVKVQVEFNPDTVKRYRLIGYENRMLNHEDFRDDTVIAEPFGSGSYCIALYEIERNDGEVKSDLKYQVVKTLNLDELAAVIVRYESVEDGTVHEVEVAVPGELTATSNIDKAIECAKIAEKLREEDVDSITRHKLVRFLESN